MMIFIAALLAVIGGIIYRMRGGWGHDFPRPIEQALFAFPILGYAVMAPWMLIVPAYVWAVAWYCTGHGGFMDLASWLQARAQETLEPLIAWLKDDMPEYWYDVLGLAVTSIVPLVPLAIIVGWYAPAALIWVILAMLGKPVGYMLSKKYDWTPKYEDGFTERGEFSTGFFTWLALAIGSFK